MKVTYDLKDLLFYIYLHPDRPCARDQQMNTFDEIEGFLLLGDRKEWVGVELTLPSTAELHGFLAAHPGKMDSTFVWDIGLPVAQKREQDFILDFCGDGLHGIEILMYPRNGDIDFDLFKKI